MGNFIKLEDKYRTHVFLKV